MKTDLEAEIRDALHSRGQTVTADSLRYAGAPRDVRSRAGSGWVVLLAAAVVVALAVVVAIAPWRTSNHEASGDGHVPAANTSWQLVRAYTPGGGIVGIVARNGNLLHVGLTFKPDNRLLGTDTVNTIDATFVPTSDGFRSTAIGSTADGYAGSGRRLLPVKSAMDAIFFDADGGSVDVTSRVHGDRLTLEVSGYTLLFHRL